LYEAGAYCEWLFQNWDSHSESKANPLLKPQEIRLPQPDPSLLEQIRTLHFALRQPVHHPIHQSAMFPQQAPQTLPTTCLRTGKTCFPLATTISTIDMTTSPFGIGHAFA
jgi:hypothetical protein